jgi:two-component system, response regulator PdtaR
MTSANNNHNLHRVRIAVADDEVELRDYWRQILPCLGYEVVGVVATGEELVRLCLQVAPDVVITDAFLDGLSGVDAIASIRRDLPVGVVFVTGRLHEDEAVGHGDGPVVLAKPFTIDELQPAVELALRQSNRQNKIQ